MNDEKVPPAFEALLAGTVAGVSDEEMTELNVLLESGPSDEASELEQEAFMDRVMATEAGRKILSSFSEGVSSDHFPREEDEEVAKVPPQSSARLLFKIELLDTKPVIWRRVSLPADATFFNLHGVIQASFGWLNTSEHEFQVRESGRVEIRLSKKPTGSDHYHEAEITLAELISNGVTQFHYLYDPEEGWDHLVTVEGAAEPSRDFTPKIHAGEGLCPPEGCGGSAGFKKFLQGDHAMAQDYGPELVARIREGKFDPASVRFKG